MFRSNGDSKAMLTTQAVAYLYETFSVVVKLNDVKHCQTLGNLGQHSLRADLFFT